jgi:hypothetical protein
MINLKEIENMFYLREKHTDGNIKKEKAKEIRENLSKDMISYLTCNYNLNNTQAKIVEAYAYEEFHWSMNEYFYKIDEIAAFAEELINSEKFSN